MHFPRRTPFYHQHAALGATFVDRYGFAAAYTFAGTATEHQAAREAVGVFEVYQQFMVEVAGSGALALLQKTCVNDIAPMTDGKVLYTSLCNEAGGMIDDLTLFRLAPDRFWLSPTPSRVNAVIDWLNAHRAGHEATVTSLGYRYGYLSIQGPNSRALIARLTDADLSTTALPYYAFIFATVADVPGTMISRTGYSGELGYELFFPSEYASHLWDKLFAAGADLGITPCGLGALVTLRMEKRYPLYGLDIDTTTNPFEAGLGWTVKLAKGDFIGRETLAALKAAGPSRQLVLLAAGTLDADLARDDIILTPNGDLVGKVTSAAKGFTLRRALALGYVDAASVADGKILHVKRGDAAPVPVTLSTQALYDPMRARARE